MSIQTALTDIGQPAPSRWKSSKWSVALALVSLVALTMLNLAFLTKYPIVYVDEPWYANTAWNWLQTGVNIDPIHSSARPYAEWPYLGNLPLLTVYRLFGLGLLQTRIVSWFFGIILLASTILVGRQSYSLLTGLLGALLLSVSAPFMTSSHWGRPDIMLAAAVMLAFWFALKGLQDNIWWSHVMAGLLIALSPDIHMNGMVFGLGFVALYVVSYGRSVFRRPGTWLFAGGVALGVAVYAIMHFVPDQPGLGLFPTNFAFDYTHRPPVFAMRLGDLLKSAREEIGRYQFYVNGLDLALIGASLVLLVVRRSSADRLLLAFLTTVFVGFVLFVGAKHYFYSILFYPMLMLIVAEALVSLIRAGKKGTPYRVFVITLLGMFLINGLVHVVRPFYQNRNYNYEATMEKVSSVIPPGARVMGMPEWWLGLTDTDYQSSFNLTYYHYFQNLDLPEALETIRPDYVIVDEHLRSLLIEDPQQHRGSDFAVYLLPKRQFREFLSQHAMLIFEMQDPWHGPISVYAIDWTS